MADRKIIKPNEASMNFRAFHARFFLMICFLYSYFLFFDILEVVIARHHFLTSYYVTSSLRRYIRVHTTLSSFVHVPDIVIHLLYTLYPSVSPPFFTFFMVMLGFRFLTLQQHGLVLIDHLTTYTIFF